MIRIWARTVQDGKITRSHIYESIDNFSDDMFHKHIEKICHELDIPTPAILKSHITNYVDFNNCVFLPRDFVESIDFEKFVIENASLNKWQHCQVCKQSKHFQMQQFLKLFHGDVFLCALKHQLQTVQFFHQQSHPCQ